MREEGAITEFVEEKVEKIEVARGEEATKNA